MKGVLEMEEEEGDRTPIKYKGADILPNGKENHITLPGESINREKMKGDDDYCFLRSTNLLLQFNAAGQYGP